jgi:hypothetical protein
MPTIGNGTNWVSTSKATINLGLQEIQNNVNEEITPQNVRNAIYTTYYLLNNDINNKQLNFQPNEIGVLADRNLFDNESEGFSYLASDVGNLYYLTATAGVWSEPVPFGSGTNNRNLILTADKPVFKYNASDVPLTQTTTIDMTFLGGATFGEFSFSADAGSYSLDSIQEIITVNQTQFDSANAESMTLTATNDNDIEVSVTLQKIKDGGGANTYLQLTDGPSSYIPNTFLKVNAGATGVDFITYTPGFSDLTDGFNTVGNNKFLIINGGSLTESNNLKLSQNNYVGSNGASYTPYNSGGNSLLYNPSGRIDLQTNAGVGIRLQSDGKVVLPQLGVSSDRMLIVNSNNEISQQAIPSGTDLVTYESSTLGANVNLRILTVTRTGSGNFNFNGIIEITGRRPISSSTNEHMYAKIYYSQNIFQSSQIIVLDTYNIEPENIFGDRIGTHTGLSVYLKTPFASFKYKLTEIFDNVDPNLTKTFNMDTTAPSGTTFSSVNNNSDVFVSKSGNTVSIVDAVSNGDNFLQYNSIDETYKLNSITSSINYNTPLVINSTGNLSRPEDNFRINIKKVISPSVLTNLSTNTFNLIDNSYNDRILRIEGIDIYYQHNSATYSGGETFSIQYSDGTTIYEISLNALKSSSYRHNLNLGEKVYNTNNFGENILIGTISSDFSGGNGFLHLNIVCSSIKYNTGYAESEFHEFANTFNNGIFLLTENDFANGTTVENQTTTASVDGNYLTQNDDFYTTFATNIVSSTTSFSETYVTYSQGGTISSGTVVGLTISHIQSLANGIKVIDIATNSFINKTFIDNTNYYLTDNSSTILNNAPFFGITSSMGTFSNAYLEGTVSSVTISSVIRTAPSGEFATDDYYYYETELIDVKTGSVVSYFENLENIVDTFSGYGVTFSLVAGTAVSSSDTVLRLTSNITQLTDDIVTDPYTNNSSIGLNYYDIDANSYSVTEAYKIAYGYDGETYIGEDSSIVSKTKLGQSAYLKTSLSGAISLSYSSATQSGTVSSDLILDIKDYIPSSENYEIGGEENVYRGGAIIVKNESLYELDLIDYAYFVDGETEVIIGTSSGGGEEVGTNDYYTLMFGLSGSSTIHVGATYSSSQKVYALSNIPEWSLLGDEGGDEDGGEGGRIAGRAQENWKYPENFLTWVRTLSLVDTGTRSIEDTSGVGSNNWVFAINGVRYIVSGGSNTIGIIDSYSASYGEGGGYPQGFLGANDPGRNYTPGDIPE